MSRMCPAKCACMAWASRCSGWRPAGRWRRCRWPKRPAASNPGNHERRHRLPPRGQGAGFPPASASGRHPSRPWSSPRPYGPDMPRLRRSFPSRPGADIDQLCCVLSMVLLRRLARCSTRRSALVPPFLLPGSCRAGKARQPRKAAIPDTDHQRQEKDQEALDAVFHVSGSSSSSHRAGGMLAVGVAVRAVLRKTTTVPSGLTKSRSGRPGWGMRQQQAVAARRQRGPAVFQRFEARLLLFTRHVG